MRSTRFASVLAACVLVAVACGDASPSSPAGSDVEAWTVSAEPSVVIGEVEGEDEYVLTNVLSGTVLSDGTIVIQNSNRGLFEVRYYDARGRHLATASRWGRGPFEFEYTFGLTPLDADSVLVAGRDDRFAVFGPRGGRVRDGRLGLEALLPAMVAGPQDPGHWVAMKPVDEGMPEPGLRRQSVRVLRLHVESGAVDTLEVGEGEAIVYEAMEGVRGVRIFYPPFSSRLLTAAGAGITWVGDSSSPEIRGYPADAETGPVLAGLPDALRSVRRADRSRIREMYATRYDGETGRRWARFARTMPIPEEMPYFDHLEVDRRGRLWVQRYDPPWTEGAQSWAVFDAQGRHVADAEVPAALLPRCFRTLPAGCPALGSRGGFLEIGDDHLLVARRDDLDVVRVQLHEIRRGAGASRRSSAPAAGR